MKEIKLTQELTTKVDDEDYDWLIKFKWHACKNHNTYYVRTNIKKLDGKYVWLRMHQLILDRMFGYDESGLVSDHIDRNGLNNQRHNLRRVSLALNSHNSGIYGKSKYRGIYWNRQANKWHSQIRHRGKPIYLGLFTDEKDAARAYDKKCKEIYGDTAILNFDEKDQIKLF